MDVATIVGRLRRRDRDGARWRPAVDGFGQPGQGPAGRHQGLSVSRRQPGRPSVGRAMRRRARADHYSRISQRVTKIGAALGATPIWELGSHETDQASAFEIIVWTSFGLAMFEPGVL